MKDALQLNRDSVVKLVVEWRKHLSGIQEPEPNSLFENQFGETKGLTMPVKNVEDKIINPEEITDDFI